MHGDKLKLYKAAIGVVAISPSIVSGLAVMNKFSKSQAITVRSTRETYMRLAAVTTALLFCLFVG